MLQNFTNPLLWVISFLAIVVSITIHEFAHALAADKLGDPNPRLQNRLSLNPLRHLDLFGTLMLIFFHFGWGKPVQFDPYNLKNPRKDAALIAAAGPISNLLTALICSVLIFPFNNLFPLPSALWSTILLTFLTLTLTISVGLAVFNLIPIFPLDGSHIIGVFLPAQTALNLNRSLRKIGPFILLLLVLPILSPTPPINYIISPITNALTSLLLLPSL